MEDIEIIRLYWSRSERAIVETEYKYGSYLRAIANRILHSAEDCEEVVSDVYLVLWNRIPPEHPKVFRHYLSGIVRNLSFKKLEYLSADKRCADTVIMLSELEECIPANRADPAELVETRELADSLNRFLATLNREDCGLFVSRYYYSLSLKELSDKYALSPRHIRYRLEKLRKKLKSHLQQEGINP